MQNLGLFIKNRQTFFFFCSWLKILKHMSISSKMLHIVDKHLCLFLFSYLQVSGWPSAGFPQKGSSPRHLLPSVALARPSVSPRAAGGGAVRVCLPHEEGWSVCQPISLPESRDARYNILEPIYLFCRFYHGSIKSLTEFKGWSFILCSDSFHLV